MSDKQNEVSEAHVRLESLPKEVQRLAEVMMSVDPHWNLEAWLIEQANMALDLAAIDLGRERIVVEQRLHRLEQIARRMEPEQEPAADPKQRNIFDCFNLDIDKAMKGLGQRATSPEQPPLKATGNNELMHPAATSSICFLTTKVTTHFLLWPVKCCLLLSRQKLGKVNHLRRSK